MNPALQRYLDAASGLTTLTAKKAEQVVKQLVRSGEAASDQVGEMVDDLLERQRGNREAMNALVRSETTRAVRAMGLATGSEVERLQRQVADLKREVQRLELEAGAGTASRQSAGAASPAPAATSGKRTGKKTAKKTSKKAGKQTSKKAGKKTARKAGKQTAKTTAKKATKKTAKKATKKTAKKAAKKTTGGST